MIRILKYNLASMVQVSILGRVDILCFNFASRNEQRTVFVIYHSTDMY